jgi:hypothetical protein
MQEEHLTVDQCDELAKALREDAARLSHGSERESLLQLAEGYRLLAEMKRTETELTVCRLLAHRGHF